MSKTLEFHPETREELRLFNHIQSLTQQNKALQTEVNNLKVPINQQAAVVAKVDKRVDELMAEKRLLLARANKAEARIAINLYDVALNSILASRYKALEKYILSLPTGEPIRVECLKIVKPFKLPTKDESTGQAEKLLRKRSRNKSIY